MLELLGFPLGTVFQGGMWATMIAAVAIWWVRGMPDRTRAESDSKIAAAAELADRFKAWRSEVHTMKNELMIVTGKQAECEKARASTDALNEQLMFLLELMICELESLDPKSKTVARARTMFARISHTVIDPNKSTALNTAEIAVQDAKQTLASTKETCEEVRQVEEDNGK